ncbi:MAG: hypothetical protein JSS27_17470 [Planctomycetes bacterium]|nr:hypothetical protein [Planctomycetota bacterium]
MSDAVAPNRSDPSASAAGAIAAPVVAEVVEQRPAPPTEKKFPCRNCGAKLTFDPTAESLHCPYCGHTEAITVEQADVAENDLETWLSRQAEQQQQEVTNPNAAEVRCESCGAVVVFDAHVAADRCPFCATTLQNKPTPVHALIAPKGVLPFAVDERNAIEAFNRWITSRWFAPTELKQLANLGQLSGIYVPYWTYDSMTVTWYTGQRGDDYQVPETYTTTNSQGQTETHTRMVTYTSWTNVNGRVDHFFDDVLICASKSLPADLLAKLTSWDLEHLRPFDLAFLAGFKTERYAIDLGGGFELAKGIMDGVIRQLCCQDIGGDHQTLSTVKTQHAAMTFKHILLPIWLAVYRYQDRTFRILVNARTGQVSGSRPYSWAKITLAVVAGAAAVATIVAVVMYMQG